MTRSGKRFVKGMVLTNPANLYPARHKSSRGRRNAGPAALIIKAFALEAKVGAVSKEGFKKSRRVLNATIWSIKSRMILKKFQKLLKILIWLKL